MIDFSDVFKKENEKELAREEKVAKENIDLTGDMARACLSTSQFKRYKDQYEKAEEQSVSALMKLTEAYLAGQFGLEAYGVKVLVYMTRLKDVKMLLSTVTNQAKKGKPQDEEV